MKTTRTSFQWTSIRADSRRELCFVVLEKLAFPHRFVNLSEIRICACCSQPVLLEAPQRQPDIAIVLLAKVPHCHSPDLLGHPGDDALLVDVKVLQVVLEQSLELAASVGN